MEKEHESFVLQQDFKEMIRKQLENGTLFRNNIDYMR